MSTLNRYVLTDEIFALLKDRILSHKLPPGDKINIDQLARELQVSNIPIREALSRLVAEGLVRMVPFKGMFVNDMTIEELDDIYEIRIHLECAAVRKAVLAASDTEMRDLLDRLDKMSLTLGDENGDKHDLITQMNADIHGMILQYCGNATMEALITMYIERIQRYISYIRSELDTETLEMECQEHRDIIKSMVERDSEAAALHMKLHLTNSQQRTKRFMQA